MAICNHIRELPALLRAGQTLLGIDNGSVAVGVAVADPSLTVASPLAVLERQGFEKLAADIARLAKERNAGGLVIGLPLELDGGEGRATQSARALARNLLKNGGLPIPDMPIAFWDERFSTAAVERMMISGDMTRRRREKTIDKSAAAYMLQGALDAMKNRQA